MESGKLKQLNPNEPDSVMACKTCRQMFELGGKLLRVEAIARSRNLINKMTPAIALEFPGNGNTPAINVYYYFCESRNQVVDKAETIFLVNNWTVEDYKSVGFSNYIPLLLGNYGKETEDPEESGFMRANEMAEKAKGINRIAYLRMDVDNLGRIFAEGLGEKKTLSTIAGLSRQMSYFFKVYLNSLAKFRKTNITNIKQLFPEEERSNLLFIYAGGDDLFISGAWNEVVEFAFDIYQCFRAYTGHNPEITLSGGISINDPKFPLYQAADESGKAEENAKANGKDSLSLFNQVFKWDEWLEIENINNISSEIQKYLHAEIKPKLLGILPFVKKLEQQNIGMNYSRNFVRDLLLAAQTQEKALEKFKDNQKSEEALAIRYYLHLPKIAYTLARLPNDDLNDSDFRTSLKSPYNAPYFRAIATWIELLNRR